MNWTSTISTDWSRSNPDYEIEDSKMVLISGSRVTVYLKSVRMYED